MDTLRDTLTIFADMAGGIKVKADNMRAAALQGFATATDLADYLVKRGLPFRDAHEVVAHAVRDCEQRGCDLADLTLAELQAYNADIGEDVHQVLTLEGSVAARKHVGGTAPSASPRKPAACWRRRLASKARACSDAKDGPGLIQGRLFQHGKVFLTRSPTSPASRPPSAAVAGWSARPAAAAAVALLVALMIASIARLRPALPA